VTTKKKIKAGWIAERLKCLTVTFSQSREAVSLFEYWVSTYFKSRKLYWIFLSEGKERSRISVKDFSISNSFNQKENMNLSLLYHYSL